MIARGKCRNQRGAGGASDECRRDKIRDNEQYYCHIGAGMHTKLAGKQRFAQQTKYASGQHADRNQRSGGKQGFKVHRNYDIV